MVQMLRRAERETPMRVAFPHFFTLVAVGGLLLGASCTPQKNVGGLIGLQVPPFSVESYQNPGTEVGREEMKGKVLLIFFWNSLSDPCREAMPFLDNLYATYKDKGLDIIAVTTEDRKAIDAFRLNTQYDFPIYLDKGGKFLDAMRILAIPSITVVARNGVIQLEGHPNEQNMILEEIQSALEQ